MIKIIKYSSFLFLFWSSIALARFVETNNDNVSGNTNNGGFSNFDTLLDIPTFLFALIFIFSIIGFLFSGLTFMASGGSERTLDSAHKGWRTSLVSLVVSLIGYIIISILKIIFIKT